MESPHGTFHGTSISRTSAVQAAVQRGCFLRIPFCSGNASTALPLLGSLRLEEDLLCLRFEVPSQIYTARPSALTDTWEVHRILPLFSTLRHRYRHFSTLRHCTRTPHKGRTRAPHRGTRARSPHKAPHKDPRTSPHKAHTRILFR